MGRTAGSNGCKGIAASFCTWKWDGLILLRVGSSTLEQKDAALIQIFSMSSSDIVVGISMKIYFLIYFFLINMFFMHLCLKTKDPFCC